MRILLKLFLSAVVVALAMGLMVNFAAAQSAAAATDTTDDTGEPGDGGEIVAALNNPHMATLRLETSLEGGAVGASGANTTVYTSADFGVWWKQSINWGVLGQFGTGIAGAPVGAPDHSFIYHIGLLAGWRVERRCRLSLGGGYFGVKTPSWNWAVGGPVALGRLEIYPAGFMTGGWTLGLTGAVGPGWDQRDQLATLWRAGLIAGYRF